MKLTEIEDVDRLVTKEHLDMKLKAEFAQLRLEMAELKSDILDRMLDMQGRMYQMIFGTYALIVAGVFINHFWR